MPSKKHKASKLFDINWNPVEEGDPAIYYLVELETDEDGNTISKTVYSKVEGPDDPTAIQ